MHTGLCVRNASIHAPCEWNAGRASSFVAGAGESSARGPRGTETRIARASSGDPRPAEKDATKVGQPRCFSDPSPVKPPAFRRGDIRGRVVVQCI